MISKRSPPPEEVHRSAAVDLGDIVLQAASALRANRGIVRGKAILARGADASAMSPGIAAQKVPSDRPNSASGKARAEKESNLVLNARPRAKSWKKSAPDSEKLTPQHAYLRAIALLCGRDYSTKKMMDKLAKLSFTPQCIDEALIRLRQEGALSEVRFAASRTNGLINRGKGPRAIQAKLKEAGVAKELISNALSELEIDWPERARELLLRKFGSMPPSDNQDWAKRARFLIARGFDEASVRSALKTEKW